MNKISTILKSLRSIRSISSLRNIRMIWIFVLLISLLLVAILYFLPNERTFAVSAKTRGLEIEISRNSSASWRIPEAIVCFRREARLASSSPSEFENMCNSRLFESAKITGTEIVWSKGTKLRLRLANSSSELEIYIMQQGERPTIVEGKEIRKGSRILINNNSWIDAGSFVFTGLISIGSVPSPGASDYLVAGRYEVWESLLWRSKPVLVNEGSFFPGDNIKIVKSGDFKEVSVSGFVSAALEQDQGIQVQFYSPSGHNLLKIERLSTEPSYVSSSWSDRAIKDPWLIGIYAVLALALVVVELIVAGLYMRRKK